MSLHRVSPQVMGLDEADLRATLELVRSQIAVAMEKQTDSPCSAECHLREAVTACDLALGDVTSEYSKAALSVRAAVWARMGEEDRLIHATLLDEENRILRSFLGRCWLFYMVDDGMTVSQDDGASGSWCVGRKSDDGGVEFLSQEGVWVDAAERQPEFASLEEAIGAVEAHVPVPKGA